MSIQTGDIALLASADTDSSGGAASGSSITGGVQNNLFPDVSDADRIAGIETDRKVFWKNNNLTDAALAPSLYLSAVPTTSTLYVGFGVDSAHDADGDAGNLIAWTANAVVSVESDGADGRVCTVYGMDNSGTPVPVSEALILDGTTPVLSTTVFSKVWAVVADSTDAARVVTIRQGSVGPVRGSIEADTLLSFLWVAEPASASAGIVLPDLAAGETYGMWLRLSVPAGAGAERPATPVLAFEETG